MAVDNGIGVAGGNVELCEVAGRTDAVAAAVKELTLWTASSLFSTAPSAELPDTSQLLQADPFIDSLPVATLSSERSACQACSRRLFSGSRFSHSSSL